MFSNLLFLAIILLMTTFAPVGDISYEGLWGGAITYLAVLAVIAGQNIRYLNRKRLASFLFLANVELITALAIFCFYFGAHDIAGRSLTLRVLLTLSLYFPGLGVFYLTAYPKIRPANRTRKQYVGQQIRFILPFAVPFMLFIAFGDLLDTLPEALIPYASVISLLFVAAILIIFPAILVKLWKCSPLPSSAVKVRLENICREMNFNYAAMLEWPVMGSALTAAIIGIVPRFRYVIFTPALLEQLSPEALDAVLIHEIGHNKRRHLLIYPFILCGIIVVMGYVSLFFLDPLDSWLTHHSWQPWQAAITFTVYIAVLAFYFRYVFGFFSRLFERQADLTIFDTSRPPEYMAQALDEVGYLSGNIHDHPSWHHFSIRQRIHFLNEAEQNPKLVVYHHQKVRIIVGLYFAFLFLFGGILLIA